MKQLLFGIALLLLSSACKKDPPPPVPQPPQKTGRALVKFDHVWGANAQAFYLNQALVHPETADSMRIDWVRYYLSNFSFVKADGERVTLAARYELVALSGSLIPVYFAALPEGDYRGFSCLLGVDSAKQASGDRSGYLDPVYELFDVATGYSALKLRGWSPQSPTDSLYFDLKGPAGPHQVAQKIELDFGNERLKVRENREVSVGVFVNMASLWTLGQGAQQNHRLNTPGAEAAQLARRFADGFQIEHVHN